ncbi:hypothetical protein BKA70DRAFT_1575532 [Coprinopsis sp. MPI-PUGE-AT-0042]|nr:hypothetical protein BKA70DRAFT_1575532 [Coprinopsis sp. MPI-PUGE-AT-0042]
MGPLYEFLAANRSVYDKVLFIEHDLLQKTTVIQCLPADAQYRLSEGVVFNTRVAIWIHIPRFAMDLSDVHQITGVPYSAICMSPAEESRRPEFKAFATPLLYEAPMIRNDSVLRRLAQSERKHHLDVESRHLARSSLPNERFLTLARHRLLALIASFSSFSRTGALPTLYGFLIPASYTLQHLHLPLQLAGTELSSVILRECTALGRLNQLRSLVLACPLAIPFGRNRLDAKSSPDTRLIMGACPVYVSSTTPFRTLALRCSGLAQRRRGFIGGGTCLGGSKVDKR